MMNPKTLDEKAIFNVACRIDCAEARSAYLNQICGDNSLLFDRISTLLRMQEEEPGFLEVPPPGVEVTEIRTLTEAPGTVIGPYKLREQIGEGGFGVVYVAEQTAPVRRKVALKIIKPGMDTKDVIARFEAERQALALMDHPNVARVLDVGATQEGRPYFVMELVHGIAIAGFCDQQKLSTRQRLELFVDVCHAVQHAHQKGIIHRDLKPSNIMITLHDGKPVPKVIDFGVAKALSRQLTDKTLYTAYGQMVGTPLYMSPEQVEMSGLDIDTRSDVYSLGVLLYELLTGTTPFDRETLHNAGYDEMRRIIREDDPPRPSARVDTLDAERLSTVSDQRKVDPRKLGSSFRGELDWIVMKALEKDRSRRYETPNSLAADIERYLNDEPVTACPPSAAYRFWKFARRNKVSMAVTTATLTTLIVVATASLIAAGQFRSLAAEQERALIAETDAKNAARQAQQEAEDARDKERALHAEAQEQRERARANFALARSSVDTFLNQVVDNELITVPGLQPLRRDLLESALSFYESFAEEDADDPELLGEMADAQYRIAFIQSALGDDEAAGAAITASIRQFERLRETGHDTLDVRLGLARGYLYSLPHDGFESNPYDEVIELSQSIIEESPRHVDARNVLAEAYARLAYQADDVESSLAYHRLARNVLEELVREFPDNPEYRSGLAVSINDLALHVLRDWTKARLALEMFQLAATFAADAYEAAPQSFQFGRRLTVYLWNIAVVQKWLGMQDEALASYRRIKDIRLKLAFENPAVFSLKGELCQAWKELGRYERELGHEFEANRAFRGAQEILENLPRESAEDWLDLAIVYGRLATRPQDVADEPTPEQQQEQARYADDAMAALQQAQAAGYRDVNVLESDDAFDPLREREEFQRLLLEVREFAQTGDVAGNTDPPELNAERSRIDDLFAKFPDEILHQLTKAGIAHAIGMVETARENYRAAEQALTEELAVREALHERQPENAKFTADLGAVHIALGDAFWRSQRVPEALERWDTGLELLDTAITLAPGDESLQGQIAEYERTIFDRYGEIGLWERAVEHSRRNVVLGRTTNPVWESRFAVLLLAMGDTDAHRTYSRLLADSFAEANPTFVLWAVAMNPHQDFDREHLLQLADASLAQGHNLFINFGAAPVAYYRAGEYQRALDTLSPQTWRESAPQYGAFRLALTHHALGRESDAKSWFERGELDYQKLAHSCLTDPKRAQAATRRGNWWELAHAQVVRREAWRVIRGQDPPGDPWQHAIQSKAWKLLGEQERAEEEFAAALSDYDALIEHQPGQASRLRAERGLLSLHVRERERTSDEEIVELYSGLIHESPDVADLYQERATACVRLKRFDEAADDALRVLTLTTAEPRSRTSARPEYQWLMEWDELFDRVAARRPDDGELWIERGRYFAWRNQWRRAAHHYRHVLGSEHPQPTRGSWLREYACALLLSGDYDGYHTLCERLLNEIGNEDADTAFAYAWTCCLGQNPAIDRDRLLEAAERVDPQSAPWNLAGHAAVNLRAGRLVQAVDHAEQSESPSREHHCSFILALAYRALGQENQGQRAYEAGLRGFEQMAELVADLETTQQRKGEPQMWLWLNVLRHEAMRTFDPPKYHEELAAEQARQEH